MNELPKIIKRGPSKKDKLTERKHALEKEIQDLLSNGVSESQIWHKRAEIKTIEKELAQLNTQAGKFNMGADLLKQNTPLSSEQIAAIGGAER